MTEDIPEDELYKLYGELVDATHAIAAGNLKTAAAKSGDAKARLARIQTEANE